MSTIKNAFIRTIAKKLGFLKLRTGGGSYYGESYYD